MLSFNKEIEAVVMNLKTSKKEYKNNSDTDN